MRHVVAARSLAVDAPFVVDRFVSYRVLKSLKLVFTGQNVACRSSACHPAEVALATLRQIAAGRQRAARESLWESSALQDG